MDRQYVLEALERRRGARGLISLIAVPELEPIASRCLYLMHRLEAEHAASERLISDRDLAQRQAEAAEGAYRSLRKVSCIPGSMSAVQAEEHVRTLRVNLRALRIALRLDPDCADLTLSDAAAKMSAQIALRDAIVDLTDAELHDLRDQAGYMLSQRMADDDVDLLNLYEDWEVCAEAKKERWRRAAETMILWGAKQAELQARARVEADRERMHICINDLRLIMPPGTSAAHASSVLSCISFRQANPPADAAALREQAGQLVREIWIQWARRQADVADHPSWVKPWSEIAERDREVDREIGETLLHYGRLVLPADGTCLRASGKVTRVSEMIRGMAETAGAGPITLSKVERASLLYAANALEHPQRVQTWRGNAWQAPQGENTGRACFLGVEGSEYCLNCDRHIRNHYDDADLPVVGVPRHYFCAPRPAAAEGLMTTGQPSKDEALAALLRMITAGGKFNE